MNIRRAEPSPTPPDVGPSSDAAAATETAAVSMRQTARPSVRGVSRNAPRRAARTSPRRSARISAPQAEEIPVRRPGSPRAPAQSAQEAPAGPARRIGRAKAAPRKGPPPTAEENRVLHDISQQVRALLENFQLPDSLRLADPKATLAALTAHLMGLSQTSRQHLMTGLEALLSSEYLKSETWKGLFTVAKSTLEAHKESFDRRARGDYETDDYGLDVDFYHTVRPLLKFLYEKYWRVTATGLENVPTEGRALLVSNHSGVLPFDGAMISEALWHNQAQPRYVRWLFLQWFASQPFVATFLARTGGVMACPENGERLLSSDHLVGVFPEGLKGVGKLYRDRYKLARFGRGGFVKMCMATRAPIVPVSVVGAEEIYPAMGYLEFISKPLGLPMLPITPTFPLLGPLGLLPLPSKWSIHFGKPLRFNEQAPARANDYLVVSLLAEKVRSTIQAQIDHQLAERTSVFLS